MDLGEAIQLIKPALVPPQREKVWADLGSGSGLFTRALAAVLESGSTIHAVDKRRQIIESTFNGNAIVFHQRDFTDGVLPFAQLDGILMANSLHFMKEKRSLLSKLRAHLRRDGQLLIIEYEMDKSNEWVPYPVPYISLKELLAGAGFQGISVIGLRQSIYGHRKMYACSAINSADIRE